MICIINNGIIALLSDELFKALTLRLTVPSAKFVLLKRYVKKFLGSRKVRGVGFEPTNPYGTGS
jgi:hypothetical protein